MNGAMIRRLRDAGGSFVLTSELGDDPVEVQNDLAEIDQFGFSLERHPYLGVAWRGPASRLCPDQIESGLGTGRIGRRIAVWNRVSSTNDLAVAASGSAANEGLVVLAEEQTEGRGRRGRAWLAPPRSCLLLSTLLFPTGPLGDPSWLTALGAVAAAEVLENASGRQTRIKWPNDVRVDGRKIAGVLTERGSAAIVGIGLNVNFESAALPDSLRHSAVSLQMLTGTVHDRSELARAIIRRLDELYLEGLENGSAALASEWAERLEPMGRQVTVTTREGEIIGRLVEADLIRGLQVRVAGGMDRWIAHATILGIDGEGWAHSD